MEDDIALSASIKSLTPGIIAQLNSIPWDFLYLGHDDTGDIGRAMPRTERVDFLPYNGTTRNAHCYAVNHRIFERLLAHLSGSPTASRAIRMGRCRSTAHSISSA